jgi:hypothetical protein
MPRCTERDFSFDVPSDWRDGSIVVFQSPDDVSIVVTREPMAEGQTLRRLADQELVQLGKNLRDFDLLQSHDSELGGRPAIHIRFTWVNALGSVEHSMTIVETERQAQRSAIVFTTGVPKDRAAEVRPVLERILESVTFDEPAPSTSQMAPRLEVAGDLSSAFVPIPGVPRARP